MELKPSRRTTLSLPAESLEAAERIARERHMNLSSVVGEALARGLREQEQAQRSQAIVDSYSKAFANFSPDELLLLDGIVTAEPPPEEGMSEKLHASDRGSRTRK